MSEQLDITVASWDRLSVDEQQEVFTLCSTAYQMDYAPLLQSFDAPIHVLGRVGPTLVSHALWITRWLQTGLAPPMRTAYVEAVCTDASHRGRGHASAVMTRLAEGITDFDIGGLSPGDNDLYAPLGWVLWKGPLFVRDDETLEPSPPHEHVMILRLPKTPPLNLADCMSAEWRDGVPW